MAVLTAHAVRTAIIRTELQVDRRQVLDALSYFGERGVKPRRRR
jgi:hypothetical protein